MFENILVRRHSNGQSPIDMGQLVETLIFYDSVNLIIDQGSLGGILREFGASPLLSLAEDGAIKITYVNDLLGTSHTVSGGVGVTDFRAIKIVGHIDRMYTKEEAIYRIFGNILGNSSETNKLFKKFLRLSKVTSIGDAKGKNIGVPAIIRKDILDGMKIGEYIRRVVEFKARGLKIPSSWYFDLIPIDDGFVVDTNYRFDVLSEHCVDRIEGEAGITAQYLLNHVHEAYADIALSSQYMSEIATSPLSSSLIELKFKELLYRREKNSGEIKQFQEHLIGDAHAIRNAINNKSVEIDEAISLINRSKRFKGWARDIHPDDDLIKEYYREVTRGTWVDRLPNKVYRFSIATGLGLLSEAVLPTGLGTAAGLATSALDAFLVERISKGWRPNQFIDGVLRPAIEVERG